MTQIHRHSMKSENCGNDDGLFTWIYVNACSSVSLGNRLHCMYQTFDLKKLCGVNRLMSRILKRVKYITGQLDVFF